MELNAVEFHDEVVLAARTGRPRNPRAGSSLADAVVRPRLSTREACVRSTSGCGRGLRDDRGSLVTLRCPCGPSPVQCGVQLRVAQPAPTRLGNRAFELQRIFEANGQVDESPGGRRDRDTPTRAGVVRVECRDPTDLQVRLRFGVTAYESDFNDFRKRVGDSPDRPSRASADERITP